MATRRKVRVVGGIAEGRVMFKHVLRSPAASHLYATLKDCPGTRHQPRGLGRQKASPRRPRNSDGVSSQGRGSAGWGSGRMMLGGGRLRGLCNIEQSAG